MVRIPRQGGGPFGERRPENPLTQDQPDPVDDLAARQADLHYRRSALILLDQAEAEDSGPETWNRLGAGLTALRNQAAEALAPGARLRFEQLSQPRQAGFEAELAARAAEARRQSDLALSRQRQDQALAEFGRLAPIDPNLARLSLAAGLAEQERRNMAAGLDPDRRRAEGRALLARAHHQAVAALTTEDPAAAARLLDQTGPVIPATERERLALRIQGEKDRCDARSMVEDLAQSHPDLVLTSNGLNDLALEAAGSDTGRRAAFQAAALGARYRAILTREAEEDRAWAAAAAHQAKGETWTDLPGPVWAALSPRQQAAIQARSDRPFAGSDTDALEGLRVLATEDEAAFRSHDLGAYFARLTPSDHFAWRSLQTDARMDAPGWRQRLADWRSNAPAPVSAASGSFPRE